MSAKEPRKAILTGAGSARGIGMATAEMLVDKGWAVGLIDVNEEGLRGNAEKLRAAGAPQVAIAACDVSTEDEVTQAVGSILEELGTIEALLNIAGISSPTGVLDTSLAEWEQVFAVNMRGTFLVTRATLPTMIERGYGRIVNLSSVSAIRGGGIFGGTHYSASKAAVLGFTRAVAREYAHAGITCNAIAPSLLDTDLAAPHLSREQHAQVLASVPAGRLGTAADVAAAAAFLCSPESAYITGEVVDVNGGSHID